MDEGSGKSLLSVPYKKADKTLSCIVPSYIPSSYVLRSLSHYSINPLYQYFCHVFGENEASRLFEMYRIGTSSKWGGTTVFWQTDINGQVRTGKVMCYNAETGHRVKEPGFCQLGTFRVEVAGFPFEAMSVWRTSSEKFIVSGNAGGK